MYIPFLSLLVLAFFKRHKELGSVLQAELQHLIVAMKFKNWPRMKKKALWVFKFTDNFFPTFNPQPQLCHTRPIRYAGYEAIPAR